MSFFKFFYQKVPPAGTKIFWLGSAVAVAVGGIVIGLDVVGILEDYDPAGWILAGLLILYILGVLIPGIIKDDRG